MSTSLLQRNATLFWNVDGGLSLGNTKMRKVCNINGPVSLLELGRSYCGLQKMVAKNQTNMDQWSDVVNVEYMNNPPDLRPYPMPEHTQDSGDPFNEQFATMHRGYGDSWCSANANMWITRPDPDSVERVNWKFRLQNNGETGTNEYGVVVITYPSRNPNNGNVCLSEKVSVRYNYSGDFDVDIPADGNPLVVFSLQHTVPKTGTTSTKYCAGISRYEVKYR